MLTPEQKQQIKLIQNLPCKIRCPVCGGGMTGEISFSVWRTDFGIGYKCWRITCPLSGKAGFITSVYNYDFTVNDGKRKEKKLFEHDTAELESAQVAMFCGKYELTEAELSANRVVQCPSRGSFIFPVFNYSGFEIGKLERWYSWWKEPPYGLGRKALYYTESEAPRVHFPIHCMMGSKRYEWLCDRRENLPLYIVEDILSSIKVGRKDNSTSCALLGTSLSDEVLDELLRVPCSKFVFILDPDAFGKAMEIKKRIGMLKEVEVKYLERDPKDTPYEELVRIL